jgi:hypothetical protein
LAIIDETSSIVNETSAESWQDTLTNSKIILFEYDKAILSLSKLNHKSYTLNTGQSSQTVTRQDLPMLVEMRQLIMSQIDDLEKMLNIRKPTIQILPGW